MRSKSLLPCHDDHERVPRWNAIIGFSEMIVRENEMMIDAARRQEYAKLINESGLHLLSGGQWHSRHVEDGKRQLRDSPRIVLAARIPHQLLQPDGSESTRKRHRCRDACARRTCRRSPEIRAPSSR